MSTSNLRVVAAGVALIVAVLTGVVTGWVGAHATSCTATGQTSPSPTSQPGQGLTSKGSGDDQQQQQGLADDTICEQSSFSVQTAAVGFIGAALAGAVAVALLFAGRRDPVSESPVVSAPPAGGDHAQTARLESERATLVQTCVYVRDRATSKAIADTIGRALTEVGVGTVAPVGVRFDPAHHEAGGATTTSDPAKVGTIAAVEVPGYVDRGVVLRAPVVTVYREGNGK